MEYLKNHIKLGSFLRKSLLISLFLTQIAWASESWEELRSTALENNFEILRAEESLYRARLSYISSAKGFLPDLSLAASASKDSDGGKRNSLSLNASYNFSLFRGGRTRFDLLRSRLSYESARINLENTRRGVIYRLRTSFGDLIMAKEHLAAAQETLARLKQNFEIISMRYEAGREDRGALLRAEADLEREKYNLAASERRLTRAYEDLYYLIGKNMPENPTVEAEFESPNIPSSPDMDKLLLIHPEYLLAMNSLKGAELSHSEKKGNLWPSLTASAGAGMTTDESPFDESFWQTSVSLKFPFFNLGKDIISLNVSKSEKHLALMSLDDKKQNLMLEIKNTYEDFLEAEKNLEIQELYGQATKERVEIIMEKYLNGLISYYEWDAAERELISSRKNIISAKSQLYNAAARWERFSGLGLEE